LPPTCGLESRRNVPQVRCEEAFLPVVLPVGCSEKMLSKLLDQNLFFMWIIPTEMLRFASRAVRTRSNCSQRIKI
jgi:hypothetical protein